MENGKSGLELPPKFYKREAIEVGAAGGRRRLAILGANDATTGGLTTSNDASIRYGSARGDEEGRWAECRWACIRRRRRSPLLVPSTSSSRLSVVPVKA